VGFKRGRKRLRRSWRRGNNDWGWGVCRGNHDDDENLCYVVGAVDCWACHAAIDVFKWYRLMVTPVNPSIPPFSLPFTFIYSMSDV
jgi:hypothetical protein